MFGNIIVYYLVLVLVLIIFNFLYILDFVISFSFKGNSSFALFVLTNILNYCSLVGSEISWNGHEFKVEVNINDGYS